VAAKKRRATGFDGAEILAKELRDPEFRYHYEQRRLVHEVAMAVRGMRASAALTQQQLAAKIGTTQSAIARLEKGSGQHTPQWETLQRIAIALGRQLKLRFDRASEKGATTRIVEVAGVRPPRRAVKGPDRPRAGV
jgi:transcriptional regulator with XRE-family HTH domain